MNYLISVALFFLNHLDPLQVQQKRWKVETYSRLDSVLHLSSVNLPGGVLRRRGIQDELMMRDYFREGDLISVSSQYIAIYRMSRSLVLQWWLTSVLNFELHVISHISVSHCHNCYRTCSTVKYILPSSTCMHTVLLQAEVQQVYSDGSLSLHTRSLKYGKVKIVVTSVNCSHR